MGFRGKRLFWIVAALIAILDLGTKAAVFHTLGVDPDRWSPQVAMQDAHRLPIAGEHLVLVAQMNPGMMWGMLQRYSSWLRVFRFIALGVILFLFWETDPKQKRSLVILGAILGGAVGNIWDSFRYEGVRDFIHVNLGFKPFDPWPAFNVADSAICLGVIALALTMIRLPHTPPHPVDDA